MRSLALLVSATLLVGCSHHSHKQLIVLGVDGMDPGFVARHWDTLPNLAKLRDQGYFGRLATTWPPQSPVAWSTFISGEEPAEHGLFDFVHRDPATLEPFSSMSRTTDPRWILPLGPYRLPISSSHVEALRKGPVFWKTLSDRGIPVIVMRMPTNYPPVGAGHELASMGTPDMRGTLGTFTFFTDDPEEMPRGVSGGQIVKVHVDHGRATLPLEGPPNSLRKDGAYTVRNIIVDLADNAPIARIAIGQQVLLFKQGEWSDWIHAEWDLIPHLASAWGSFRIFVKQVKPRLEIYVSPVNIDPLSPALPISSPAKWSAELAKRAGSYSTLGIPEDTSALRQGVFSFSEFRSQTRLVEEEEHALLRAALQQFHGGLLFFYFSSVDQNAHMMWGKHDPELLDVYRNIDARVGEVRRAFPKADLVILSDHGFTIFDRAVNLNAWLKNRGFLNTNQTGDDTNLLTLNWSATQAYAIGLNGLYLNRVGREAHGIVHSGQEANAIAANLKDQLLAWRDPVDGSPVVQAIYEEHPAKENAAYAPDFIVGYAPRYRSSWQTALGGTPEQELEDNTDAWIADHCVNPAAVPGVLFLNRRAGEAPQKIQDVTTYIESYFR